MSHASAPRFRTSEGEHLGQQVIVLSDGLAETQAILVPSFGFPCVAFRVALADGVWNVVAEPPDAESFRTRIGRYGVPIMFPWPNRIRDGRFTFGGREYQVPISGRGPHASHGVTRTVPGPSTRPESTMPRSVERASRSASLPPTPGDSQRG
jgi:aldose 1-epimerase